VRGGKNNSSSTSIDDDQMTIRIVRDECSLRVDSDGEIGFAADDRDIERLDRGGYFEIEERQGRERRRVEVAREGDGLTRRWLVNRDERPYDDAARAWLADILLVLVRRAGLNAEARAVRIFEQRGADGLIAEIDQLQSDYVAGRYYGVLFARAQLTGPQLTRLLDDAGARIDSDYELAQLLTQLATRGTLEAGVQRAYIRAAETLDSDYEQRRALDALVKGGDLTVEALDAMLASASRLDSDYERAELLVTTASRYPAGRALPPTYLTAIKTMNSDYERRRVLDPLLVRNRLSPADRAQVLEMVTTMDSDYERAEVLLGVVEQGAIDDLTRAPFFRSVEGMSSDHERQRVLTAVVAGRPDEATTLAVLATVRSFDSDYSKAEVLTAVARRGLESDRVREAYRTAAETIGSEYDRERALRAGGMGRT
jgi:hypothetical protein